MVKTINAVTIGAVVRDARLAAGLTQTELANRIGASRFWVAQFEKGKPSAALGLALKALRALGLVIRIESVNAADHTSRPKAHRSGGVRTELDSVIAHATLTRAAPSSIIGWPTAASRVGRSHKA